MFFFWGGGIYSERVKIARGGGWELNKVFAKKMEGGIHQKYSMLIATINLA